MNRYAENLDEVLSQLKTSLVGVVDQLILLLVIELNKLNSRRVS